MLVASVADYSTTSFTIMSASCADLSASFTTFSDHPLINLEMDFELLHFSTRNRLSVPKATMMAMFVVGG
jgi:hypothetical protein